MGLKFRSKLLSWPVFPLSLPQVLLLIRTSLQAWLFCIARFIIHWSLCSATLPDCVVSYQANPLGVLVNTSSIRGRNEKYSCLITFIFVLLKSIQTCFQEYFEMDRASLAMNRMMHDESQTFFWLTIFLGCLTSYIDWMSCSRHLIRLESCFTECVEEILAFITTHDVHGIQ